MGVFLVASYALSIVKKRWRWPYATVRYLKWKKGLYDRKQTRNGVIKERLVRMVWGGELKKEGWYAKQCYWMLLRRLAPVQSWLKPTWLPLLVLSVDSSLLSEDINHCRIDNNCGRCFCHCAQRNDPWRSGEYQEALSGVPDGERQPIWAIPQENLKTACK